MQTWNKTKWRGFSVGAWFFSGWNRDKFTTIMCKNRHKYKSFHCLSDASMIWFRFSPWFQHTLFLSLWCEPIEMTQHCCCHTDSLYSKLLHLQIKWKGFLKRCWAGGCASMMSMNILMKWSDERRLHMKLKVEKGRRESIEVVSLSEVSLEVLLSDEFVKGKLII